ncbi:MAG TPA: DUF2510 domain-containing protein [Acidimicrobiales bacterium]|jgi:hypothetical protein|nr:DUF2510 domain-containing protein [Acidimicrobiales bacterium]
MWYGYGHNGSWVFIVIVVAMFVLRMTAGRRRSAGGGRPGRPTPPYGAPTSSPFQPGGPADPSEAVGTPESPSGADAGAGRPGHTGIPAGWMVDPSGRHQQRYWSGTTWTEHVTDDGMPSTDPPPGAGGPVSR